MAVDWSQFRALPIQAQQPTAAPAVDWSQFTPLPATSPQLSTQLPTIAGPMGFSPEFREATGQSGFQGFLNAARPAAADVFGNYEDVTRALQNVAPGARMVKDANGFEVLELPNGQRFAMNKPGIQGHEVASLAGNVAAFTPAARIAGLGKTLLSKAAIGGLASGATDAALQKTAAGKESIDPVRLAFSAGGGAFGEIVAPTVGRLATGGIDKLRKMFGSADDAVQAGRAYAEQLGIKNPSDELAKSIAARWDEIKAGANPASIVAEADIGLKLTQGQKSGDVGALRREEMLRASDSEAGKFMRGIDESNRGAIDDFLAKMRNTMAGGNAASSAGESFDKIARSVQAENAAQKGVVNTLYDRVRDSGAVASRGAVDSLPARLTSAVRDFDIDAALTPGSAGVLNKIMAKVSDIGENVTGVSLRVIEAERRKLNNAIGTAANPTDKRALMTMKHAFDDWYDDLAETSIIKGDKGAIDAMKAARDARSVLGARFEKRGKDDLGGKLIEKLVQGNASGEELAQAAIGASQVSKASAAQFVKRLKGALQPANGPINPAWGEMKAAVLQKLTTGKGGETLGPQAIVGNLKEALRNRSTLMQELYSPQELTKLQRTTAILDAIVPKGLLAKTSGTGERMFAQLEQLLRGIPGGGMVMQALQAPARAATARNAYMPMRPRTGVNNLTTAASAAYGQQQGGN